ncbi:zinc finger BED domain-containing protein 6-like [Acyrthosiphon pisum]|uniref:BED-type domain-containing protein n=1 Tax=Acyrthosiphon pisum TaxID=7029 RepID=A0A8R2F7P0_ACYPI|nr:zinc finger BED domain-containing protein 6-like [Acyrthosiphon pisum]|eukprot:XP_008182425.1 PREDICTED: zinc finger BED domain-containing protein 6-like [Acyrthosiphon pisum]
MSPLVMNRKRSTVWHHFTVLEINKAKCDICSEEKSFTGGSTGNLLRHLKTKHPTVPLERSIQDTHSSSGTIDDPQQSTSSTNIVSPLSLGTTPQPEITRQQKRTQISMNNFIQGPIAMTRSKAIDKQLMKMIVKEYHPFSVVEDQEFRNLIKMLNPSYIIPSRKTVTQSLLPQMYEMTIERVKDQLKNVSAVCMTTDGWTSLNNESFVAVTVHFIDPENETQLSSVLLGCENFRDKHTADNLAIFLRNTVDEWNLTNKITGVVSDNASNIKSAIVKKCNWRYLSCFAHSINLVVQTTKLQDFQKQTGLPQLKLKLDCPTRWNSTYDMFDRILSIKESVIATLAVLGNSQLNCFDSEEWTLLEHARDILKIFYDVTVEIILFFK